MVEIHRFLILLSVQLILTQASDNTTAHNLAVDSSLTHRDPGAVTTVASTLTTISAELIKIRDYAISLVNKNFTSQPSCKELIVKLIQGQTSVEASCKMLSMAKGALWSSQHCEEHDYNLLNNALCSNYARSTTAPVVKPTQSSGEVASTSTSISAELIKIRDYAISLVKTHFTSEQLCIETVVKLIQGQTSVEASCKMLSMAKGALWSSQHCNEHDYNLLNNALCSNDTRATTALVVKPTQSPEDLKLHRENVMCVIDNHLSSEECRNTAHSQSEGQEDPDRACSILKSFQSALSTFHCTTEDYEKLNRVICEQQLVPCSPVSSLLRNLTSRCRGAVNSSLGELLAPSACNYVESHKQYLTANSLCTAGDYEKLHQIVCSTNPSLSQAIGEGQRVEKAEETITTKLTKACRDVIWPEFQMYSLIELCTKVNRSGMSLVRDKVCTVEDFGLLKTKLCIVHREYTPEEQKVRDQLHELIPKLSDKCKTTMEEQERQMQESTVEEACEKLKASHEALRTTETCSEKEITQINKLVCNRAGTLILNWVISLVAFLIYVNNQLYL